ncbi:MAG: methyltransferase protein [Bacteroidota bacterium]|nr:methyltransferase protein [Bacteroidota bacterium]
MKLHRNLCVAVVTALKDILLEKKQADLTVEHLLQSNKSWGSRDRNFIAGNIYHIIRYKRLYEFCCNEETWGESSLWRALGAKLILEGVELLGWPEFSELNKEEIIKRAAEASGIRKIRESIPDWLDKLGEKELGVNWEKEITALNTQAKFSIRVNTLKSNKSVIKILFTEEGIDFSETDLAPDALIINSRKNLRNLASYKTGLFEVQDISSQLVAPMLQVEPGMNVIDGCAGAGGKTLHVAALMQNEGEILAVDINPRKLEELQKRAVRAGCPIIKEMEAAKLTNHFQARLSAFADRILLDVPCSGLGVLRRKPDAKWSLTALFIEELKKTQAEILDEYAPMLKPGGFMVYSTCSILPAENEIQVRNFIERNKDRFELMVERRISPADTGFDGFYMARIKRLF